MPSVHLRIDRGRASTMPRFRFTRYFVPWKERMNVAYIVENNHPNENHVRTIACTRSKVALPYH